jgi:hypothetical protein
MKITLAEALLRRKELSGKVALLTTIKKADVFELKTARIKAHEGFDDVTATVPKLTASQVTAEHDFAARQLRLIDAAIQNTNWTTFIEVAESTMADYEAPKS